MELGEATLLADTFITCMIFKVDSLPLYERSRRAALWWQGQGSSLPVGQALDERRVHLRRFSSRDEVDKARGRSLHLTMSALTLDREEGRCPALSNDRCSIYESRPFTCRTVPLHYSRPLSVLDTYLHRFIRTPGYQCSTTPDAPIVLEGGSIADPSLGQARDGALDLADADRGWKTRIAQAMNDPEAARALGLPTYRSVLHHSDAGSATSVPMIVAWRVAREIGLLSRESFEEICSKQIALIDAELAHGAQADLRSHLLEMLSDYEVGLSTSQHSLPPPCDAPRLPPRARAR